MDYAIIAAGNGSRLRQEGLTKSKPLVMVNGETLIERLIRIFTNNGASLITVIINEQCNEVRQLLENKPTTVPLKIISKNTTNSLDSFAEIARYCNSTELCLSTIDTIFDENEFRNYIDKFRRTPEIDALFATTRYIDDEKPLWVATNHRGDIVRFANKKDKYTTYISGGIYCLRKKCIDLANEAIKQGIHQMRYYQQLLIDRQCIVRSFAMGKIIDLDHVSDIGKAEALIAEQKKFDKVLIVKRNPAYSPCCKGHDNDIINAVSNILLHKGCHLAVKEENELLHPDCDRYEHVVSMSRSPQVLDVLERWEKAGSLIINSPRSCKNSHRSTLMELLNDEVPIARSCIISTNDDISAAGRIATGRFWIKRADFQSMERTDVVQPATLYDANQVLASYRKRGIMHAVVSEHIDGYQLKFYGVCDTNFFYSYHPRTDKFGTANEQKPIPFDRNELKNIAACAAERVGLTAYGGDAIVDHNGNIYIIDLNDFPSFAPCKDAAAKAIANLFFAKMKAMSSSEPANSFRQSLKSDDTEEPIDIKFYRPLGYRIAKAAQRLHITPNNITIASIFLGVAGGILFFPSSLKWNCLGMLLLIAANSLDSADGQLARLTNNHTRLGRILDGLAGELWFITIYVSICLRLYIGGYGWWIWLLGAVAGACHILHAAMADYYRNIHLLFVKGNNGSEHDNSKDLSAELQNMKLRKDRWQMIFLWFYRNYTLQQELLSPNMSRFTSMLKKQYSSCIPSDIAGEFRRRNKPYIKYTNILQFNTRTIFLFICLFANVPWLYFVFDIVVMNAVLIYLIRKEEALAGSFLSKIIEVAR